MGELDETGFRNLVLWLENRKIRYYTEADRKELKDVKAKGWEDALLKYLDELGAGKPSVEGDLAKQQVADWLASYAIGMEYSDRAAKLAKIVAPPAAPATATTHAPATAAAPARAKEPLFEEGLDTESPEFVEALHKLAATLGVPKDDSAEAMVRACAAVLKRKLSAEALAKAAADKGGGGKRKKPFDVKDYPPGFDTGDGELNKAASLLRLLYVADLRKLQDEVNALISQMQEYTANPKTDSSLGKVGR